MYGAFILERENKRQSSILYFVLLLNPRLYFLFLAVALWDSFLELRIKLQRATIGCNCLPTTTISDNDVDEEDDELREAIDESKTIKFVRYYFIR